MLELLLYCSSRYILEKVKKKKVTKRKPCCICIGFEYKTNGLLHFPYLYVYQI